MRSSKRDTIYKAGLFALKLLFSALMIRLAWNEIPHDVNWPNLIWPNPWEFSACLSLMLLLYLLLSLRWKLITQIVVSDTAAAKSVGFRRYLALMWAGMAVNQVLPSFVGGDALRIGGLRYSGLRLAEAAKSVFLDRVIGFLGLGLLAIPAILHAYPADFHTLILTIALLGLASAVLLLSVVFIPEHWWTAHFNQGVPALRRTLLLFLSRRGLALVVMAVLGHAVNMLIFILLARAFAINVPVGASFVVLPIALFATMLPVSLGGWGVREVALVYGFAAFGVPEPDALIASVIFGMYHLLVVIPSIILLFKSRAGGKGEG